MNRTKKLKNQNSLPNSMHFHDTCVYSGNDINDLLARHFEYVYTIFNGTHTARDSTLNSITTTNINLSSIVFTGDEI